MYIYYDEIFSKLNANSEFYLFSPFCISDEVGYVLGIKYLSIFDVFLYNFNVNADQILHLSQRRGLLHPNQFHKFYNFLLLSPLHKFISPRLGIILMPISRALALKHEAGLIVIAVTSQSQIFFFSFPSVHESPAVPFVR